jgi:hypothetical protein
MTGLTKSEILRIANQYIGVSDGYLGDLQGRTHVDFYLEYCGLDIDLNAFEGTNREKFVQILRSQSPANQAKILRGVLQRFPLNASSAPPTRTEDLHTELNRIAKRLENHPVVSTPTLESASEALDRAIADMELLVIENGAISGIDRVHTAIHGYLRIVCDEAGIQYGRDDSLVKLLKRLENEHIAFKEIGIHGSEIRRVLNACGTILDALNSMRNNASLAHPNQKLLGSDEAVLALNVSKTLLQYLIAKLGGRADPH